MFLSKKLTFNKIIAMIFSGMSLLIFLLAPIFLSSVSALERDTTVGEKEMIHLKWNNLGDDISYQFQMANDKDFRKILIDQRSKKPEISIPFPTVSGTYYIRIKPIYSDGQEGVFSMPQSYTVSAELNPPKILIPEEMREYRGRYDIQFSWSTVPRASAYHFVLARDRNFTYIFYEKDRVTGTSLLVRSLDFGTYYVKVSSIAPNGMEGPFSEPRPFIVVPPPPLSTPKR